MKLTDMRICMYHRALRMKLIGTFPANIAASGLVNSHSFVGKSLDQLVFIQIEYINSWALNTLF